MLIETKDLSVGFRTPAGLVWAVRGLDLRLDRAESLGIVGESGSGKSTAALALMGLLGRGRGCRVEGEVIFDGQSLAALSPAALRRIWGRRISMVFQDPQSALNPVLTIEEQVAELVRAHPRNHRRVTRQEAREMTLGWFAEVGLPDPSGLLRRYPHQLSGGQLQRVMIAMALICEPELVIADEPTTALDLTIQSQILSILTRLCAEKQVALIVITHDLAVVAETTQRVAVMYSGQVVERGRSEDVLLRPQHPYTAGLLAAMPRMEEAASRLTAIEGAPMAPSVAWPGCRYAPRCPRAESLCGERAPLLEPKGPNAVAPHAVSCHFA